MDLCNVPINDLVETKQTQQWLRSCLQTSLSQKRLVWKDYWHTETMEDESTEAHIMVRRKCTTAILQQRRQIRFAPQTKKMLVPLLLESCHDHVNVYADMPGFINSSICCESRPHRMSNICCLNRYSGSSCYVCTACKVLWAILVRQATICRTNLCYGQWSTCLTVNVWNGKQHVNMSCSVEHERHLHHFLKKKRFARHV